MQKKILFICNDDWFFLSHRIEIAKEAIKNDYKVYLAAKLSDSQKEIRELGIVLKPLSINRGKSHFFGSFILFSQILCLIYKIKPNIIHSITIKPVILGGIASRIYKKASFVASVPGLGYLFISKKIKDRLLKFIVMLMYRLALSQKSIKIIFQNSSDLNLIKRVCKLNNNKIVLIKGSGVDLNFFKPLKESSNNTNILFASRLLKTKGVIEFYRSALQLKSQKYKFLIAGKIDNEGPDGISKEKVKAWAESGVIKFLGDVKDIKDLILDSQIVVLPSYYGEGLPKILIEAAACGKPIITTNHPGCRDAVEENISGLLIPIKDSKSLSRAIQKIMTSYSLRKSMGKASREFAVRNFDINLVVKKHIEIYESLIAN